MKNYQKTAYAANKYSEDIVYNSEVSGDTAITLESFLKSDPTLTEADFKFWKNWSDSNYEEESTIANRVTKNNVSLSRLDEAVSGASITLEEMLENAEEDDMIEECYSFAIETFMSDKRLSEKMKRRFILRYEKGMKYEDIAEHEGVSRKNATKSITAALSIFKSYFVKKYLDMGGNPENLI